MKTVLRFVESRLRWALERQKSVLRLGPRQIGKTTLVEALKPDLMLNFLRPVVRQRYERTPRCFKLAPRITAIPWQEIHSLARTGAGRGR